MVGKGREVVCCCHRCCCHGCWAAAARRQALHSHRRVGRRSATARSHGCRRRRSSTAAAATSTAARDRRLNPWSHPCHRCLLHERRSGGWRRLAHDGGSQGVQQGGGAWWEVLLEDWLLGAPAQGEKVAGVQQAGEAAEAAEAHRREKGGLGWVEQGRPPSTLPHAHRAHPCNQPRTQPPGSPPPCRRRLAS